jgi:hypothetical protein
MLLLTRILLVFSFSLSAFAAPSDFEGWLKKDCAADMKKLCVKPSSPNKAEAGAKPRGCLKEHYAELSPACKKRVDAMKTRRQHVRPNVEPKKEKAPEARRDSITPAERVLILAKLAVVSPRH